MINYAAKLTFLLHLSK